MKSQNKFKYSNIISLILGILWLSCEGIFQPSIYPTKDEGVLGISMSTQSSNGYISLLISVSDTSKTYRFPELYFDPKISPCGEYVILKTKEFGTPDANGLVLYSLSADSVTYLKDLDGTEIIGNEVIWSLNGERIYFDIPSSSFYQYCYFDFSEQKQTVYSNYRDAIDFMDKNEILTFYKSTDNYYYHARMDLEGMIISHISNPFLTSELPDRADLIRAFINDYSPEIKLYLGTERYRLNEIYYRAIIATNENGDIYNSLTRETFIDANPIYGSDGTTIFFERMRHHLEDPDYKTWIMKLNIPENSQKTFLAAGAHGNNSSFRLTDYSDKVSIFQ